VRNIVCKPSFMNIMLSQHPEDGRSFNLFLEQSLNTDCKALAYLDIGNCGVGRCRETQEKLKSVESAAT